MSENLGSLFLDERIPGEKRFGGDDAQVDEIRLDNEELDQSGSDDENAP